MIGAPVSRVDGPLKVSGRATYSYEEWGLGPTLYGVIVESAIARGRITRIDTSRAERAPGVRRVITHRDAPPQGEPDMTSTWAYGRALAARDRRARERLVVSTPRRAHAGRG